MNSHLELFSGILINKGGSINCVFMYLSRQWHGTYRLTAVALNSLNDLLGRLVDNLIIISLKLDPYSLTCFCFLGHCCLFARNGSPRPSAAGATSILFVYLCYNSGTNCLTAFSNSKSLSLFHGNRSNKCNFQVNRISRHNHFSTFW